MKLATYRSASGSPARVGVLITIEGSDYLFDVTLAYASYLSVVEHDPRSDEIAAVRVPPDMLKIIEGGEQSLGAASKAAKFVKEEAASSAGRARLDAEGILHRADGVRYLPPVPRPGKVISAGVNYAAHVAEVSTAGVLPRPTYPVAFAKFPSIMVGHGEPIIHSRHTKQLDYEIELAFVIGKRCKDVPVDQFQDVVFGYTVFNDISMRDIQFMEMKGGILTMGKNLDTAGPNGPYLVTKDEIPDPQNLRLRLRVNGEERQNESTHNMLFSCAELVEYYSRMTLEPGDLFTTGSPAGVAIFRDEPERYLLKPGDVVEAEIEGIGVLRNQVVAEGS